MGCCHSRMEIEETVSRCKARKRYMKQFVEARNAFSASHAMYIRSLRATASSLLHFADAENTTTTLFHHHHYHHLPPEPIQPILPPLPPLTPMPPPPPTCPTSDTWTSSVTASSIPPPPPPPVYPSAWDFWDTFVQPHPPLSTAIDEEWEAAKTINGSEVVFVAPGVAASMTAPLPTVSEFYDETKTNSDLAMVVSKKSKDLVEVIKELGDYFLKAAEAGAHVSFLLEVPKSDFYDHNQGGKISSYRWSQGPSPWIGGLSRCSKLVEGTPNVSVGNTGANGFRSGGHCSTVERLYAWEKKLYQEIKICKTLKRVHEKKVELLRKLEMNRAEYVKTEKTKKEVEKLESHMMVASEAIDSISAAIIKLRETQLYPQLIELVKGLMCMWRSMYECHQVQKHIVQQLEFPNKIPTTNPTSEIHRQATLQLELQVQQWHQSFCNLFKAHRDYIQSLTSWLRLSLSQFRRNQISRTTEETKIISLCEEWHVAVDRISDKAASEGIKTLLAVIHGIVVQQAEEHKQKKKSDSVFKELEKKVDQLRSLECKYGPYSMHESSGSMRSKDYVAEKRVRVENLKAKAEEEKRKYEKLVSITRAMTVNNLQMGFPHVFQGIVGFSNVCMEIFESLYNLAKLYEHEHDVKRILPKENSSGSV